MNQQQYRSPAPGVLSEERAAQLFAAAVREQAAGRTDPAEALYRQILAIKPLHVGSLSNLGAIHRGRGQLEDAIKLYERALEISPDYAKGINNLGDAHWLLGHRDKAEVYFRRAVALDPAYIDAHFNLGGVLVALGRWDEAEAAFERVIELQPDHIRARTSLGQILQQRGRLHEAAEVYLRTVDLHPRIGHPYYQLAKLASVNDGPVDAEALSERLEALRQRPHCMDAEERAWLLFAAGKTFQKLGQDDRAFEALAEANTLVRSREPFDIGSLERHLDAIASEFDASALARLSGEGVANGMPIFIVGMARSGTTLIEQIVSAHPKVHAGGEMGTFRNLVKSAPGKTGAAYPEWTAEIDAARCRALGQAYLNVLPRLAEGETRLTDKSLAHHEHIGLIQACLPNAPIIHCRRDPRDIALSCFSMRFGEAYHGYSYDLADLGRYWRAHDRLMRHWRALLPAGRMLDVQYEDLVADIEGWARRLIAYCGLEWDDACLRFYESERMVRTASFAQVRQPIYRDSLERWRRYDCHLGPLFEALGPPYSSGA